LAVGGEQERGNADGAGLFEAADGDAGDAEPHAEARSHERCVALKRLEDAPANGPAADNAEVNLLHTKAGSVAGNGFRDNDFWGYSAGFRSGKRVSCGRVFGRSPELLICENVKTRRREDVKT
jgi:hypothetical protein